MDVSDWTIDQRMRFPDWCFGNRQLIGLYLSNDAPGTDAFAISPIVLPDPVCIWCLEYLAMFEAGGSGYYRAGLADSLPADEAEMNNALEIYPNWGILQAGPNRLPIVSPDPLHIVVQLRKGMVLGGKKLVIQNHCEGAKGRLNFWLLISSVPTDMAGWLAHSKV
ncbi:hypothetical protein ES705_14446 [subsurface metagenome]